MRGDLTIQQDWARYTPAEQSVWDTLFARQTAMLTNRAVPAFLNGLDILRLTKPGIPDFAELPARLMQATVWQVVEGLLPDDIFFNHLAHRFSVAGCFIRRTICRTI